MPSIADIRSSYPMYANMSDADLTAALQSRFGDDYVSMSPQNLAAAGKAIAGMAEVPVAAATGAVAVPLAGLAGAAALPEGAATATDVVDEVRQGLTYQPRTAAGAEGDRTVGEGGDPPRARGA